MELCVCDVVFLFEREGGERVREWDVFECYYVMCGFVVVRV